MSSIEIREQITKLREQQMSLVGKMKGKGLPVDNPMQKREIKRTLARMITTLIKRGEPVVGLRR